LRDNVAFMAISDKNISRSALTKFCVTKTNKYLQLAKSSAALPSKDVPGVRLSYNVIFKSGFSLRKSRFKYYII
jgi:hypothetical protein